MCEHIPVVSVIRAAYRRAMSACLSTILSDLSDWFGYEESHVAGGVGTTFCLPKAKMRRQEGAVIIYPIQNCGAVCGIITS